MGGGFGGGGGDDGGGLGQALRTSSMSVVPGGKFGSGPHSQLLFTSLVPK